MNARPTASECLPFLRMGWPSSKVAAANGVPGMPSRIAEIAPPQDPPTKIAINNPTPSTGVNDITTGKKKNYPHQWAKTRYGTYNHPEDGPDQNQENCFKAEGKGYTAV